MSTETEQAHLCVDCTPDETGDALCEDADPSFPFCEATAGCVACVDSSQCSDVASPICDLETFACGACTEDVQCNSGVCDVFSGECVAEVDIIYVDNGGSDGASCGTVAAPCRTIAFAITKVTPSRQSVLLREGSYPERVNLSAKTLDLIGHGTAVVNPNLVSAGQEALNIGASSSLLIRGVDIAPASAVDGTDVVTCVDATYRLENLEIRNSAKFGINSFNCQLTAEGVTITDNTEPGAGAGIGILGGSLILRRSVISDNQNGGLTIRDADYSVTNTLILNNGGLDGDTGGVLIEDTAGHNEHFEFNTIVGGEVRSSSGRASGIHCPSTNLVAANNIIVEGAGAGIGIVVDTACAHSFSFLEEVVAGAGNITGDPQFANELSFELEPTSPCIDAADPSATLEIDFGGEPRPQGSRHDIGADEAN